MLRASVAVLIVLGQAAAFTPSSLRPQHPGATPMLMRPHHVAAARRSSLNPDGRQAVMMAAASSPRTLASPASVGSALMRVALALTASLLGIFLRVGRAVAAERTVRAVAATSAPFVLSGNTIKWSVVTMVLGGAYIFRREETPILTETVVEDEPSSQPAASSAAAFDAFDGLAAAADSASPDGLGAPPTAPVDDVSLNADLFRRMQDLASQRANGEDDEGDVPPPVTPSDSTNTWATGNTAVLEPPRPGQSDEAPSPPSAESGGLLDGEPAVDFPAGFPLVDGEWNEADTQPAASDDQIAMLQRMFGSSAE